MNIYNYLASLQQTKFRVCRISSKLAMASRNKHGVAFDPWNLHQQDIFDVRRPKI